MKLPDGIDPTKPVGELTDEELRRIAGSCSIQWRWENATDEERAEHGRKGAATRKRRLTKARRREIASNAGRQRAINAGQKLREV